MTADLHAATGKVSNIGQARSVQRKKGRREEEGEKKLPGKPKETETLPVEQVEKALIN